MNPEGRVLSYGVRSVKSMRKISDNKSSNRRIIREVENYFTNHIDFVISRCITCLLCVQPSTTLETLQFMLEYFTEIKAKGKFSYDDKQCRSRPRRDQKLLLSTIIAPIITKLVNRMVFIRPFNPIDYFIEELKLLIHFNSDLTEQSRDNLVPAVKSNNADVSNETSSRVSRPESAPMSMANRPNVTQRPLTAMPQVKPEAVPNTDHDSAATQQISDTIAKESRKVQVGLFGLGAAGKSTILSSIQGDLGHNIKPTVGFRPVNLALDSSTTVCFYDLGGSSKIREIWPQYYHDIHGSVFVVDSKRIQDDESLAEIKTVFHTFFNSAVIQNKPMLIFCNVIDGHALDTNSIVDILGIDPEYKWFKVVECVGSGVIGDSGNLIIDSRIEFGVEWLINTVSDNYGTLSERVKADTAIKQQEDMRKQFARERKVLKNKVASRFYHDINPAIQSEYELDDSADPMTESEGIEFLSSEIGEDAAMLPPIALTIAKLVGYQRLSLQIIGDLKSPISKKKTPMTWDHILHLVSEIRIELGLN